MTLRSPRTASRAPSGRWRARAFGRAAPIRKRTTHIAIVLDERLKISDNSSAANLTS
jgi:hypothetical protein